MSGAIAIKVGNEYLDIQKDAEINFNIRNGMFFRELIPTVITYDFNLLSTPKNKRIFNFIHHKDAVIQEFPSYNASIYVNGILFQQGEIQVKDISDEGIKLGFKGEATLLSKLKGLSLRDIDMGSKTYDEKKNRDVVQLFFDTFSNKGVSININGKTFAKPWNTSDYQTLQDLADAITNNTGTLSGIEAKAYPQISTTNGLNTSKGPVLAFESKDLTQRINSWDPDPNGSNPSHTTASTVKQNGTKLGNAIQAMLNQWDSDANKTYPDINLCAPPIKNTKFYQGADLPDTTGTGPDTTAYHGYINDYGERNFWVFPGYKYARVWFRAGQELMTYLPHIFVKHVLQSICSQVGLNAVGDFMEDDEMDQLVLYNEQPVTFPQDFGGEKTLQLNNYVPDYPALDFIKELALNLFNMVVIVDQANQEVRFDYLESVLQNDKGRDYTTKVLPTYKIGFVENKPLSWRYNLSNDGVLQDLGKKRQDVQQYTRDPDVNTEANLPGVQKRDIIRYVRSENLFYLSQENNSGNIVWKPHTYDLVGVNPSGAADTQEKTPDMLPMAQVVEDKDTTHNRPRYSLKWLVCHTERKGSSPYYNLGSNKAPLRLMFYRGLIDSGAGYTVPAATTGIYDMGGNKIGAYALKWTGSEGLYENFWKGYNDFITNNKLLTLRFNLDIHDFYNLQQEERITVYGRPYYWREIKGKLSMKNGLEPVKIQLVNTQ